MENKEMKNVVSIADLNKDIALKKQSKETLAECLNDLNKDTLKAILGNLGISKGVSKLKKSEQIELVTEKILDSEVLSTLISTLNISELNAINECLENGSFDVTELFYDKYINIVNVGMGLTYLENESVKLIIPKDVLKVLKNVDLKTLEGKVAYRHFVDSYMLACGRVYGVFDIDFFIETFNRENEFEINKENLIKYFEDNNNRVANVRLKEDLLTNTALEMLEGGLDRILSFRKENKVKYKIFEKGELIKFKNAEAITITDAHTDLLNFIKNYTKDRDVIMNMLIELDLTFAISEFNIERSLNIVNKFLVEGSVKSNKEIDKLVKLLIGVYDNTRKWSNKGNTNRELNIYSRLATKNELEGNTNKKVGRNDPCPCGSGKKYKKCCMNK
ncbi:MAG: YecA family protein [Sarcina sp.]